MESISRNVILDLLPVYIAGEASDETRSLIERYAQQDQEIAGLIRTGILDSGEISPKRTVPEELEMKTFKRVRRSIRLQMLYVGIGTASLLMIPLIAMMFTGEVNWGLLDFAVMGILLFGTGLMYVLLTRLSDSTAYRFAVGIAAVAGFLLIWVNLAVGIIGSEGNPANLLYLGVLAVGFIGSAIARFRAKGMSFAMYAAALIQILVPISALIIWRPVLDEPPGVIGVFVLSAFFAVLFAISGLLFSRAARKN